MFRKIFASIAILSSVITGSIFANEGFYIGGGGGLTFVRTEVTPSLANTRFDLGGFGFTGGGIVGYDIGIADEMDLALEFFANGTTTRNRIRNNNIGGGHLTFSERYNWGFRILPGFQMFKDVQTHLILGYVRGNLRININGQLGTLSKDFNANGYQVGGGLTLPLSCNVALRMDGIFTGYGSRHRESILAGTAPVVTGVQLKPVKFDTTVMLVFNF
jgi:opacity protein-like surface antigen